MGTEHRGWPHYLLGGRIRTTTVVLMVAFLLAWWLYAEYKPAPQPVQAPATEVVPPGFVPDPNYTWVPRTEVQEPRRTTSTPTTTETTTPTETTSPTTSTSPTTTSSTTPSSTSPTTTTTPTPGGLLPLPGPGPSPSPSR